MDVNSIIETFEVIGGLIYYHLCSIGSFFYEMGYNYDKMDFSIGDYFCICFFLTVGILCILWLISNYIITLSDATIFGFSLGISISTFVLGSISAYCHRREYAPLYTIYVWDFSEFGTPYIREVRVSRFELKHKELLAKRVDLNKILTEKDLEILETYFYRWW